jgi:hypothetical protein
MCVLSCLVCHVFTKKDKFMKIFWKIGRWHEQVLTWSISDELQG